MPRNSAHFLIFNRGEAVSSTCSVKGRREKEGKREEKGGIYTYPPPVLQPLNIIIIIITIITITTIVAYLLLKELIHEGTPQRLMGMLTRLRTAHSTDMPVRMYSFNCGELAPWSCSVRKGRRGWYLYVPPTR